MKRNNNNKRLKQLTLRAFNLTKTITHRSTAVSVEIPKIARIETKHVTMVAKKESIDPETRSVLSDVVMIPRLVLQSISQERSIISTLPFFKQRPLI